MVKPFAEFIPTSVPAKAFDGLSSYCRDCNNFPKAPQAVLVAIQGLYAGGVCHICERPETYIKNGRVQKLALDHDHRTGEIRGLICQACNILVGILDQNVSEWGRRALAGKALDFILFGASRLVEKSSVFKGVSYWDIKGKRPPKQQEKEDALRRDYEAEQRLAQEQEAVAVPC